MQHSRLHLRGQLPCTPVAHREDARALSRTPQSPRCSPSAPSRSASRARHLSTMAMATIAGSKACCCLLLPFPRQIKSSITFSSFRCSYGAPALASFVAGEHHQRSRHRCCFCLHGWLASGDNGARQGDQRVRGDLPVLPQHSLAANVASLRPEPAILLRRRRTSGSNKKQLRVPDAKPRLI